MRKTTYVYFGSFLRFSLEGLEAVYCGDCVGWSEGREIAKLSGGY